MSNKIAILGCGNIGSAIAKGFVASGKFSASGISITRRHLNQLETMKSDGFTVCNNTDAVNNSNIIIASVEPSQLLQLLEEISPLLNENHLIISTVSAIEIDAMKPFTKDTPVVRAMPNTAISVGLSMTCLCSESESGLKTATELFDIVGETVIIDEELMASATALCACGTAFFLRAIRAASQGGVEIGFHAKDALLMSAQTALGASKLLISSNNHPEREIDHVTTPRGATISGLNEMEHRGFSSAMIKGIITSTEKINEL
jgi:pyrroline-5-carboxylate reductase